jgi:hypothetical protein
MGELPTKEIEFLLLRDRVGRLRLEYIIAAAAVATFVVVLALNALR